MKLMCLTCGNEYEVSDAARFAGSGTKAAVYFGVYITCSNGHSETEMARGGVRREDHD